MNDKANQNVEQHQQWPPPVPVPSDVQAQPVKPRQYGFAIGLLANALVPWILPDIGGHFHGSLRQYSDGMGKALFVSLLLLTAFSIVNVVLDIHRCLWVGDRRGINLALFGVGANVIVAVGWIILGFAWAPDDCACGPT